MPQLQSFPLFPSLPSEIQHLIFHFAFLLGPSTHHAGIHVFSPSLLALELREKDPLLQGEIMRGTSRLLFATTTYPTGYCMGYCLETSCPATLEFINLTPRDRQGCILLRGLGREGGREGGFQGELQNLTTNTPNFPAASIEETAQETVIILETPSGLPPLLHACRTSRIIALQLCEERVKKMSGNGVRRPILEILAELLKPYRREMRRRRSVIREIKEGLRWRDVVINLSRCETLVDEKWTGKYG